MRFLLSVCIVLCVSFLLSGSDLLPRSGDKIAFLGDSITYYGNRHDSGFVNLTMGALAANGIRTEKIPAGVGGNKSPQMLERVDRDVIAQKPRFATLSCGVNDVWHQFYSQPSGVPLPEYKRNMTSLVDRLQKSGITVLLFTASVITENPRDKRNQMLNQYNDFLRQLAREKKCILVDVGADMREQLGRLREKYPTHFRNFLTVDGVHLNPLGDKIFALALLKALGFNPAQLAKAEQSWKNIPVEVPVRIPLEEYEKLSMQDFSTNRKVEDLAGEIYRKGLRGK